MAAILTPGRLVKASPGAQINDMLLTYKACVEVTCSSQSFPRLPQERQKYAKENIAYTWWFFSNKPH